MMGNLIGLGHHEDVMSSKIDALTELKSDTLISIAEPGFDRDRE